MAYGRGIYQVTLGILNGHRMRENEFADERRGAFRTMYLHVHEIGHQLTVTAIGAAKAVLNGSDTVTELTRLKKKGLSLQQELDRMLRQVGLEQDYLNLHYRCRKYGDIGCVDDRMYSCLRDLLRKIAYQRLNEMTPLSLYLLEEFSLGHYPEVSQSEEEIAPKRQMKNIFHFCCTYARDFSLKSPSLILQGGTGLGKTHLSLTITREAVGKDSGMIYLSAQNMVTSLEGECFGRVEEDEDTNMLLFGCDLLLLDDLGTEFSALFIDAAVYDIVNTRLMAGRPTIISTNLSSYELQKRYSERFISQIIGSYVRLTSLGKDVRQQKWMKRGQRIER